MGATMGWTTDDIPDLGGKTVVVTGANAGIVGLAWTHLERGAFDKALPYFEELAKAMPDDASVKQGLERARAGAAKP